MPSTVIEDDNPFRDAARTKKAYLIADALEEAFKHLDTDQLLSKAVRAADPEVWKTAAAVAECKPPSKATIEIVVGIIERREANRDKDPFRGL